MTLLLIKSRDLIPYTPLLFFGILAIALGSLYLVEKRHFDKYKNWKIK